MEESVCAIEADSSLQTTGRKYLSRYKTAKEGMSQWGKICSTISTASRLRAKDVMSMSMYSLHCLHQPNVSLFAQEWHLSEGVFNYCHWRSEIGRGWVAKGEGRRRSGSRGLKSVGG